MIALGARRMLERSWLIYQRYWVLFLSGFAEPLIFLLAADVGLDPLVGEIEGPGGRLLSYPEFVGPGLLASAAMTGALIDVTYSLFFKLKYAKIYDAILATPLDIDDAVLGEVMWSQIRGAVYSGGFLGVLVGFGIVSSWWALLVLPAALLLGFAFAATGAAATTFVRNWGDLDYVQLALLPMFLFSTGFFPLDVYPGWARPLVQLTPLYHGVDLIRSLSVGHVDPSMIVHVGYLVALGATGFAVVRRRFTALLVR